MSYPGSRPDVDMLQSIDTNLTLLLKEMERVAKAVEQLVELQQDDKERRYGRRRCSALVNKATTKVIREKGRRSPTAAPAVEGSSTVSREVRAMQMDKAIRLQKA